MSACRRTRSKCFRFNLFATVLSLGTIDHDTLDDDTENAELMLIGGQNAPIDVAPEPICLDQISVDNAIAGII